MLWRARFDFSKRGIALVGNGPVEKHNARQIDRHPFVVRFNCCKHFGESGTKIDALVFVPTGPSGEINASSQVNSVAIEKTKEFWFTKSLDLILEEKSKPLAGEADISIWNDWSEEIRKLHFRGRPYRQFGSAIYHYTKQRLAALGAIEPFEPSSGILTLIYLKTIRPWEKIMLFGFTHEGWRGHAWEAERQIANELAIHAN